jgi:3-oxoacyl-[acyl-carrier-protein] synthase II
VAVTGLGVMAPIGKSIGELLSNLAAGRSGIAKVPPPMSHKLRSPIAGSVPFDGLAFFDPPRLRMLDRVSQLALIAAGQAVEHARLDFANEISERCGIFVGSGMGGAETTEEGYHTLYAESSDRIKPYTVLSAMTNAPAAWIAIEYGLSGPNLTFSTACSSSAVALGEAARRIAGGDADVMIAGGAEAPLSFGVMRAWEALRTLASEDPYDPSSSCRPFSRNRSGLVLAEGAAFAVLEGWDHALDRGATIHAQLSGYGCTCDAAHITRPTVNGQSSAMRAALRSAGIEAAAVDYINAHGTATAQNDAVETAAIKSVFGERAYGIPVSSTKSTHGHLLGAAGALEVVISVVSLNAGLIPPTMHLDVSDPECDLDYVSGGSRASNQLSVVMSNSFAFGGTNAVLIAQNA